MSNATTKFDSIFCEAIDIPAAADREAFIAQACDTDLALRKRVQALVDAHFQAGGSFLVQPALDADSTVAFTSAAENASTPAVGTVIGPYTLREQIGEGGMGLVFVAEQTHPVRRKVALKLIKPGMDSRQVVARFEAERQALALMDHPNIARVLDAGTTSEGRPYFVMELVKGVPITDYCDANRLSVPARLGLFVQVCRAVQHAHQKGVIHRDLKPSNVLVAVHDVAAVAKVIDFGIAKAVGQLLTDKTVYTAVAQMIGTPLYMSPEQAGQSSLDVDTRTDVYALGVLLYELLTGTTPIDPGVIRSAGFDEVRRLIREDEPARPSARLSTLKAAALSTVADRRGADPRRLAGLVRGELDWVVMKCLEKDRERRYESAAALAADIDRYLTDEPIQARPPSAAYRLRKFARRNRAAGTVAVIVAAALAVLAGGAGYVVRDRAARVTGAGQKVAEALAGGRAAFDAGDLTRAGQLAAEADGHLGGDRDRLPDAAEAVARFRREVEDRRDDLDRLQKFLKLTGDAQDKMSYGRHLGGERVAEEALAMYRVLTDSDWLARVDGSSLLAAQKGQVRESVFVALVSLADFHARWYVNTPTADAPTYAFDLLRRAEAFHPPTRAFYFVRSVCHDHRKDKAAADADRIRFKETAAQTVWDHYLPGHTAGWNGDVDEAVRAYRTALRIQPDHYNSLFFLAVRLAEKKKEYPEAIGLFTGCIALRPENLFGYVNRAECYEKLGQLAAAEADYDSAVAAVRTDDDRIQAHIRRRKFYRDAGRADKERDEHARVVALYEKSAEAKKAQLGPDHADTLAALNLLGVAYSRGRRRPADAVRVHEHVLARRKEQLGPDHPDTLLSTNNLATAYHNIGRGEPAVRLLETVLAAQMKQPGPGHADTLFTMGNLAGAYKAAGRPAEAIPLYEQVLAKRTENPGPVQENTLDTMNKLAHAYQDAGRLSDALPMFERSLTEATQVLGSDHRAVIERAVILAVAYGKAGRHEPAERLIRDRLERVSAKEGADSVPTASWQALLGQNLLYQKRYAEAEPPLRQCLATRERLSPDDWKRFNTMSLLGDALLGQAKHAEAEPLLLKGYEGMKEREAQIPPGGKERLPEAIDRLVHSYGSGGKERLPEAIDRLVRLYEATGHPDKARAWRDKRPPAPAGGP